MQTPVSGSAQSAWSPASLQPVSIEALGNRFSQLGEFCSSIERQMSLIRSPDQLDRERAWDAADRERDFIAALALRMLARTPGEALVQLQLSGAPIQNLIDDDRIPPSARSALEQIERAFVSAIAVLAVYSGSLIDEDTKLAMKRLFPTVPAAVPRH